MRADLSNCLYLTALLSYTVAVAGRATIYGGSFGQSSRSRNGLRMRYPSTPQEQPSINVPAPGLQSQNTSTTTARDTVSNIPGMVTNSAAINNEVNCRDLTTGRDNKCWNELDLTRWLEEWMEQNTCFANEPFASCFLRKEGFPGLDCTGIKINACTSPQGIDLMRKPEVFYIAYNIYGRSCYHTDFASTRLT